MDNDEVDDQGGETTWPEYEAPDGVPGNDEEGDQATQDENTSGATSTADGDQPVDDAGDAPAPTDAKGRMIPAYRLEQVQQKFERELEAQRRRAETLEAMVRNVLGGRDPRGQDDRPALTPEQDRLRKEFLKLFPEFNELLPLGSKAKDILGLAERAPGWDRDNEQYWQRVATSTTKRLSTAASTALGVKELDAETEGILVDAFINWVKADRTNERHDRYEGQDGALVTEFLNFYTGRFRAPQQRQQNANAIRKAQAQKQLPRGGQSSSRVPPPPTGAKKKDSDSDDPFDSVGSRAWNALQADQDARQ